MSKPGKKVFTFERIMAAHDMDTVDVPVPEWSDDPDEVVTIRPLAPGENITASREASKGGTTDLPLYQRLLFTASLIDPLLTEEQIAAIWANRSAVAIDRIVAKINEINGFTPKVQEALKTDFRAEPGQTVEVPADGALPNPDGSGA